MKINKTICLVTHYQIYSASQALRDFIRQNGCKKLLYISHPLCLPESNNKDRSYIEKSSDKKITKYRATKRIFSNLILRSVHEFFLTLTWLLTQKSRIDIYIGVDNFNAFHGLFLKKIGKVRKVVYYTIDYFPRRFSNPLLNKIYHALDKFCVRNADETWNVSEAMVKAREKYHNMKGDAYARQYTVPIGVWVNQTAPLPFVKVNTNKIVFIGHLVHHMGVDLAIRATKKIIKKIPEFHFDIIGGGEELDNLKNLADSLNLNNYITFYGWIRDRKYLEHLLSDSAVGIAPFNTKILDDKVKNADPAKLKDYMLMGMPVITTDAISPSTQQLIIRRKCGIIISYDEEEFIHAVIKLISNTSLLFVYRTNVLKYIKDFDYNLIFSKNLKRILDL